MRSHEWTLELAFFPVPHQCERAEHALRNHALHPLPLALWLLPTRKANHFSMHCSYVTRSLPVSPQTSHGNPRPSANHYVVCLY